MGAHVRMRGREAPAAPAWSTAPRPHLPQRAQLLATLVLPRGGLLVIVRYQVTILAPLARQDLHGGQRGVRQGGAPPGNGATLASAAGCRQGGCLLLLLALLTAHGAAPTAVVTAHNAHLHSPLAVGRQVAQQQAPADGAQGGRDAAPRNLTQRFQVHYLHALQARRQEGMEGWQASGQGLAAAGCSTR